MAVSDYGDGSKERARSDSLVSCGFRMFTTYREPSSQNLNGFTVSSLFAGLGGFALAFRDAGFVNLWANELDRAAADTYRFNHPTSDLHVGDVRKFSPAKLGLACPDVITAGFPCQPFSAAGARRGVHDSRGVLYKEIARIANEYGKDRPKVLLLENVPNLLALEKGATYNQIENALRMAGYWIFTHNRALLNTRIHTEIPQNRERLFMVALSTDHFEAGTFEFPDIERNSLTVGSLVDREVRQDPYYYFDTTNNRFGALIAEKVEQGQQESIYQLRRVYVREYPDWVPTLTANMGMGGHNVPVLVDPWGIRKLTPIECARLQGLHLTTFGFPDSVTRAQRYKQLGNSVSYPLISKLASGVRSILEQAR